MTALILALSFTTGIVVGVGAAYVYLIYLAWKEMCGR